MSSLIQELLKEMEDMENTGEYDHREENYVDKEHAADHANKFLDRAKDVLHYNKKEGDGSEVAKLAQQYAKDYYEAICDEIDKSKFADDVGPAGGEMQ